ncbi:MAG: 2-C-methyl-D-erythritol 4-phosphate cytidylyltransferase [Candidatus Celerinatantimonas neptuna]|nr:MAG: 2-C-methyl-D-erythritol 4-phosphate cytidylyltransferase [Candidatus Celerinatantimonas neptuna]
MNFSAIIPAAGIGQRMGAGCPKQYLSLLGQAMLCHSIQPFLDESLIHQVVIALHPDDHWFTQLPIASHPKVVTVLGGKERVDSVLAALTQVPEQDWVLVHDAARPCLTRCDLTSLLKMAESGHGAILASPVRDTMKRSDLSGHILKTVDREQLWHAQTPQCFPSFDLRQNLIAALESGLHVTDEASAMEWAGYPVQIIQCGCHNLKVTHLEDLSVAEFFITKNRGEQ